MKLKITTVVLILTTVFGGYLYIDARYAPALAMEKLEKRLDKKILKDDMRELRERIWTLKDRFGEVLERASPTVKEEYRELEAELKELREDYNQEVK